MQPPTGPMAGARWLAGRRDADLALDLGSTRLRWADGRGEIHQLEAVLARRGREVVAIGPQAAQLADRAPPGIEVLRPFRAGVVTDHPAAEVLLRAVLRRARPTGLRRPRVLVAVGAEVSELERRATLECLRAAGAGPLAVVDRLVAAAVGVGLPVTEPIGHLLLDFGASGSRAAILSLGAPVLHHATEVGGDRLHQVLLDWLRDAHGLRVEQRTAETITRHLVDLEGALDREIRICGHALPGGVPRELPLSTAQAMAALDAPLRALLELVLGLLAQASPQLSADLLERGAVLCGGGSLLRGLPAALRRATDLPVVLADQPDRAVVRGAARILADRSLYSRLVDPGS